MTLQDVIKRGLELGLEAVEVYACNSESNTLKLDEGKLESYNIKDTSAYYTNVHVGDIATHYTVDYIHYKY